MDRGDVEEDLLLSHKKKVFPGSMELHPNEKAIILHYKTKVLVKSPDGSSFYDEKETKDGEKLIKVKAINGDTDINQLANSIIEKNKFLTSSRLPELSTLLYQLQSRALDDDVNGNFRNSGSFSNLKKSNASVPVSSLLDSDKVWLQKQFDSIKSQSAMSQNTSSLPSKTGSVSLDNLDTYLEDLYEDIPRKLVSTSAILELARTPSNIPLLLSHSSLLSALARVLREDGRKSIDLSLSLMSIFYVFSSFSSNHSVLTLNKIGDLSLRILETEAKRWLVLQDDLKASEGKAAANKTDKSVQQAYQTNLIQFKMLFKKQNHLLFVTLSLLLNLAEDLSIEVKMVKRDILKYLLEILFRKSAVPVVSNGTSSELVSHSVLLFLSKLGIFQENKDILISAGQELVQELSGLTILPSTPPHLKMQSLKFLLILSHDASFRSHIVSSTLPTFLIDSLTGTSSSSLPKSSPLNVLYLQLLYQCTLDASSRSLPFTAPTLAYCLRLFLEEKGVLSLEGESGQITLYAISILINLATAPEHVSMIVSGGGALKFLFKKGLKSPHPLIFKIIRNVSASEDVNVKYKFLDYIDELVSLFLQTACDSKHDDIFIELMGILANLSIPDFDYAKLITSFNLLDILSKVMSQCLQTPSRTKENQEGDSLLDLGDDILLESINLLSTFSSDEAVASLVSKTLLLDMVVESMIVKDEDDSIMLQACYCIHRFLQYPKTCHYLIKIPHLVDHLIDLLYDTNPQIRQVTDACLEIISQIDSEWETRLKRQKFAFYNSEWIKMIMTMNAHGENDDSRGFDDDQTSTSASYA